MALIRIAAHTGAGQRAHHADHRQYPVRRLRLAGGAGRRGSSVAGRAGASSARCCSVRRRRSLLSWRTNENVSFAQVFGWMLFDIGLPLVVVTAYCAWAARRGPSPWLAPLFIALCWASQAGVDLLAALVEAESPIAFWLAGQIGAVTAIALFALVPWLIACGRPAPSAAGWAKPMPPAGSRNCSACLLRSGSSPDRSGLSAIASEGWGALLYFLPCSGYRSAGTSWPGASARRPGRPPCSCCVFRQDANVQDIFDRVIERWRLTGNTAC